MRRRDVLAGLAGAAVAHPLATRAQQPRKVARIGFLATGFQAHLINAFREGLGELGYVEGTNLTIEYRQAESRVWRRTRSPRGRCSGPRAPSRSSSL